MDEADLLLGFYPLTTPLERVTRDLKALCTLWAHSNGAVGVPAWIESFERRLTLTLTAYCYTTSSFLELYLSFWQLKYLNFSDLKLKV